MSNTSPRTPNDIQYLRSAIRVIPDFPKPGVSFKDITPLLRDPVAYNMLVQCMKEKVLSIEGGVHSMYACACARIRSVCMRVCMAAFVPCVEYFVRYFVVFTPSAALP